jgi:hypothetical protein
MSKDDALMRTLRVRLRPPPKPIEIPDSSAGLAAQQWAQERRRQQQARISAERAVDEMPSFVAGVRHVSPSTYTARVSPSSSSAAERKRAAESLTGSSGTRTASRSEQAATWQAILHAPK